MKTYQMYYERDFLAVFIPFISLFFMGDIVVLIFCAFFSSEGIASSFCTWMILSLSVAGLVFLTPVLCHVFVIQHRRKVALSGERKLSEVYCTYK